MAFTFQAQAQKKPHAVTHGAKREGKGLGGKAVKPVRAFARRTRAQAQDMSNAGKTTDANEAKEEINSRMTIEAKADVREIVSFHRERD